MCVNYARERAGQHEHSPEAVQGLVLCSVRMIRPGSDGTNGQGNQRVKGPMGKKTTSQRGPHRCGLLRDHAYVSGCLV